MVNVITACGTGFPVASVRVAVTVAGEPVVIELALRLSAIEPVVVVVVVVVEDDVVPADDAVLAVVVLPGVPSGLEAEEPPPPQAASAAHKAATKRLRQTATALQR